MKTRAQTSILIAMLLFTAFVTLSVSMQQDTSPTKYPEHPDYDFKLGEAQVVSSKERQPTPDEVNITRKYYEIAEKWVGAFPLKLIDARDAQPMLVLRTNANGQVDTLSLEDITAPSVPRIRARDSKDMPAAVKRGVTQSDKPSAIFRDMVNLGTMPGSRIMRVSTDSVDWVYIFRKTSKFFNDPNLFEENGLIAYNRNSGKTVFFAGAEYWTFTIKGPWKSNGAKGDTTTTVNILAGKNIPPPSSKDLISVKNWRIPIGNGCSSCHSAGPFVSFPFTDYESYEANGKPKYYRQPEGQKGYKNLGGKFGDNVVPMRTPGMLYEPLIYQLNDEFLEFFENYRPENKKDTFYRNINESIIAAKEKPQSFQVKRLMNPELQACRSCHQIGNLNYLARFPFEAFWFPGLPEGKNLHIRAQLYRKNISAALKERPNTYGIDNEDTMKYRMKGFHNRKLKIPDLHKYVPDEESEYIAALNTIQKMNTGNEEILLSDHWTLNKVRKNTWLYIEEQCASCHNGSVGRNKSDVRLATQRDFSKYINDQRKKEVLRSRLFDQENPMPPGGRFQESVRDVVWNYLKDLK